MSVSVICRSTEYGPDPYYSFIKDRKFIGDHHKMYMLPQSRIRKFFMIEDKLCTIVHIGDYRDSTNIGDYRDSTNVLEFAPLSHDSFITNIHYETVELTNARYILRSFQSNDSVIVDLLESETWQVCKVNANGALLWESKVGYIFEVIKNQLFIPKNNRKTYLKGVPIPCGKHIIFN